MPVVMLSSVFCTAGCIMLVCCFLWFRLVLQLGLGNFFLN